jgi:hypothetical protein
MDNREAEALVRSAVESLFSSDAATARSRIRQVTATGRANGQIWAIEADACRRLGDMAGMEQAVDHVLAVEPSAIRALVWKGDCRDAAGDHRGASRFYTRVIDLFESGAPVPDDVRGEFDRINQRQLEYQQGYGQHLSASLLRAGIDEQNQSARFRQSIGILSGKLRLYLQQPSMYFFPGLPHLQFYEREDFSWAAEVESKTDLIREEVQGLLADGKSFSPYLAARPDTPATEFHGLHDNPDWSSAYLWRQGDRVEVNAARCPETMKALEMVPMPFLGPRAPSVMFSRLAPGARIPAHCGAINTRLICHLPLIVPEGCGFRVGNEVRQWEVGKLTIFDDSIEHEAWNESDEERVVLIFDIWRPELSEDERHGITELFAAIDTY